MEKDKWLFYSVLAATLILQIYVLFNKHTFFSWPYGDEVMHLVWGAVMFLFLVIFLRWKPYDALLGVVAWQILWEGGEMIDDKVFGDTGIYIDYLFFDGIKDTLVNLAGGIIGWLLWLPVRTRELYERRLARLRSWTYHTLIALLPMLLIGSVWRLRTGESPQHFATTWMLITIPIVTIYTRFKQLHPAKRRKEDKAAA
jgi:hypothetical protein